LPRPFCLVISTLVLVSFLNSAEPEEKASEVSVPSVAASSEAKPEAPPVPAPEPAKEPQPEAPVIIAPEVHAAEPQMVPVPEEEIVLFDDSLPSGATTEGVWDWDVLLKYSGERSHTEPPAKGLREHSYRAAPVAVPRNYLLEQHAYLDPRNVPAGIMLKFRFEAEDGKEGEIGVYREGEEEVFVFNDDEPVIYDGTLPEAGKWAKWTVDPNDLGLEGAKITGISFIVYGGKANWDYTRFVPSKNITKKSGPGYGLTN